MVNSERNLTLLQQAVDPLGEAMPDWQLIAEVARAMGYAEAFALRHRRGGLRRDQAVREPEHRLRPARRQLRPARDRTPVQWPAPPGRPRPTRPQPAALPQRRGQPAAARTPGRHRPALAFATASGRAVFHPRPHLDPRELPDDDYPFVLNTGRLQHQWHTMTKTGKVRQAEQAQPRAVRRAAPGGRRRARRRRRRPGRDRVAARPGRAAGGGHRPGAARQPASPRSTGTTSSGSTWRQRA